jgi:hypothetical protein
MEECIEFSSGREIVETGRSRLRLSDPRCFLLSLLKSPVSPGTPRFGTFCGMLIARISSSRKWSSFRFLVDRLLANGESYAARLLRLVLRCSFPDFLAVGGGGKLWCDEVRRFPRRCDTISVSSTVEQWSVLAF